MSTNSKDYELFHYGVKGMKWGVTRDEQLLDRIAGRSSQFVDADRATRKANKKEADARYKEYKKSTTKQERKEDRRQALSERGKYLVDHAMKNPDKVMITRDAYGGRMVTHGKAFTNDLARTGMIDVKYTEITNMTFEEMFKK